MVKFWLRSVCTNWNTLGGKEISNQKIDHGYYWRLDSLKIRHFCYIKIHCFGISRRRKENAIAKIFWLNFLGTVAFIFAHTDLKITLTSTLTQDHPNFSLLLREEVLTVTTPPRCSPSKMLKPLTFLISISPLDILFSFQFLKSNLSQNATDVHFASQNHCSLVDW